MILRTLVRRFAVAAMALLPLAVAATPTAYVSFSPSTANRGDPILLAISLIDSGTTDITNAQLASGVFQFPAGMTTSTTMPAPTTNCPGATVASPPGSNTMSFSAPLAPASGCGFTVYVDFAAPGTYTATLPLNAITSDQGPAINAQAGTITIVGALVTNASDAGPGSLRDAINTINVNCAVGPQKITFAIPGTGPFVIQPVGGLPAIACSNVTIDGYSQPGSSPRSTTCAAPGVLVELSGSSCSGACNGIEFSSFGERIQGLAIHSWGNAGISIAGRTEIYGNIIGSDSGGTVARGNTFAGIQVLGDIATIGSGSPSQDNLIVANGKGIYVNGGSVSVVGNQIGGLASCAPGNGNGIGIFFDTSAATSTVDSAYIHFSTGPGIAVAPGATFRYEFRTNSIADNGGIGIDLNNDGPPPNDDAVFPYDQDGGANGTQNYPTITAISYDAPSNTTTIAGVLLSAASTNGTVELYQNLSVKPGITEGNTFIGSSFLVTDAAGKGTFSIPVSGNVDNVSAMVQFRPCADCAEYSSEFSPTVTRASVAPPLGPVLQISQLGQFDAIVNYAPVDVDFTLSNIGDQDLVFGAAPFGFTPGDFTLSPSTGCVNVTLKPGESCNLQVRFTPAAAGPSFAALTITSNAVGSPVTENLSGYGLLPLQISIVTPANPAAGSATTATLTVTNPNTGSAPSFGGVSGNLVIDPAFTIDVTNPPSCPTFDPRPLSAPLKRAVKAAVVTAGAYWVGAGQTCTLYDVQLTAPATAGAYTFTVPGGGVRVGSPATWDNRNNISVTVTVAAAALTLSPSSLAFGNQNVGTTSAPQSVLISSSSRVSIPITKIAIPSEYAVSSSCTTSIPPTGCAMVVAFTPTAAGPANGAIIITAGGVDYSITVTGTGVAPTPVLAASVTPSTLAFAPRAIGTRSPPAAVTVTNTGSSPLSIRDISISGDFGFDSTCPITTALAPGASCTVNVTFAPLVTGPRGGSLTVATNDPNSPHVVPLSGSGVIVPTATLAVDPGAVDFGTLTLGTTSAVQLVTLANTGNADAVISTATSAPFALAPPPAGGTACGSTLAAGASCVVGLTFTPVVSGGVPGTLVVTSNASNPRITVSLSGQGTSGPPPRALTVPGTIDFGAQAFGTRSAARALTLTNTTTQSITVSDIVVTGDFSVDDGCPVVPARGSCSVNVYFLPTARGGRNGVASITVAGDTRPYTVSLVGDGGPNPLPVLNASPSRIGFGNALVGPTGLQKSITLTNAGELPVLLGTIVSPGDFLVTSHCPATIPVGGTCTLDVVFYPRLTGLRSETLQVPSNAGNSPARVDLSGTGCSLPNAARARIGQLVCSQ